MNLALAHLQKAYKLADHLPKLWRGAICWPYFLWSSALARLGGPHL